jgi:hypothetical protein
MQTIQLAPGDILDDKYRLEKELGRGGFSRVYKATQLGMDRPVALKLMTVDVPQRQEDDDDHHDVVEQLITRFEQEAKLISRLKSSATISVYDYGQTREGLFFMALEYVQGRTLAQLKPPELPLPPARLVKLLEQVLVSLREAHALGVIHRDLKPANIMIYDHLDEQDLIKVLDFGIAKIFDNKDGSTPMVDVTRQGVLVGTPRYMAPELINGKEIGPWTDLYALGLICVELLTGQRAIAGKGELELLAWQLGPEQVRLPAELAVPWGLRRLVDKLCEKELEPRYKNAKEVLEDLTRWQEADPGPVVAADPAPAAVPTKKGGAMVAIAAAAAAILALGGVAFMAGQQGAATGEGGPAASAQAPADAAQSGAALVQPPKPAEPAKVIEQPKEPAVAEKPPEPIPAEPVAVTPEDKPADKPADKPTKGKGKPPRVADKGEKTTKPAEEPATKEPEFKAPKVTIETEGKPKRVVETVDGALL